MANKAPWVKAFPKQARKLRPERSKSGGIKSRSQSEEVRMAVYRPIAEMFKLIHPRCQCCTVVEAFELRVARIQPGFTDDVHHKFGREGLMLFDTRHWLAVCRTCHGWIHAHPTASKMLGLIGKDGKP